MPNSAVFKKNMLPIRNKADFINNYLTKSLLIVSFHSAQKLNEKQCTFKCAFGWWLLNYLRLTIFFVKSDFILCTVEHCALHDNDFKAQ